MAYRKPFTPLQRREAVRAYRSYQKHYQQMRRTYAPRIAEQSRVLRSYGEAILEMRETLRPADRAVNVALLNQADAWARWLAMEYWQLRGEKD
jgi:hypothetical protein